VPRIDNWKHFHLAFVSDPGFRFDIEWKVIHGLSEYSLFKEKLNSFFFFFFSLSLLII